MELTLVTTDRIEGKRIVETFGLVVGNTVKANYPSGNTASGLPDVILGDRDVMAMGDSGIGIGELADLMTEAREDALNCMVEIAVEMGANAVIGLRLGSLAVTVDTTELVAYGTAVLMEDA